MLSFSIIHNLTSTLNFHINTVRFTYGLVRADCLLSSCLKKILHVQSIMNGHREFPKGHTLSKGTEGMTPDSSCMPKAEIDQGESAVGRFRLMDTQDSPSESNRLER